MLENEALRKQVRIKHDRNYGIFQFNFVCPVSTFLLARL